MRENNYTLYVLSAAIINLSGTTLKDNYCKCNPINYFNDYIRCARTDSMNHSSEKISYKNMLKEHRMFAVNILDKLEREGYI